MLQCNLKKWDAQLTRSVQKMDPWRRKQYRKARYRKRASRFQLWLDICEANDEPDLECQKIWVI